MRSHGRARRQQTHTERRIVFWLTRSGRVAQNCVLPPQVIQVESVDYEHWSCLPVASIKARGLFLWVTCWSCEQSQPGRQPVMSSPRWTLVVPHKLNHHLISQRVRIKRMYYYSGNDHQLNNAEQTHRHDRILIMMIILVLKKARYLCLRAS